MSKATDEYREHLWVMNDTGYLRLAGTGRVFVSHHPAGNLSASWVVYGVGFETNPDGHFTDNGSKRFTIHGREDKVAALALALTWATEQFGVPGWEKSPFGSWMPTGTNAIMKAKLKAAKANPSLKCYAATVPPLPGWDDRRRGLSLGKPVSVWVAARTRPAAVSYLAEAGLTADPDALRLIHPDRLTGMTEGQIGADLGHLGSMSGHTN